MVIGLAIFVSFFAGGFAEHLFATYVMREPRIDPEDDPGELTNAQFLALFANPKYVRASKTNDRAQNKAMRIIQENANLTEGNARLRGERT
jgi:hypothetical protein